MASQFTYEPLAVDPPEIRVLDILPGSGEIECEIRHARFNSDTSYEALSYCWGTDMREIPIRVNNADFNVYPSLHSALVRLRDPHHKRTVWADAICINQHDFIEKNTQVPLMRAIYRSCQRVVVWLGEADASAAEAFEAFEFAASAYDKDPNDTFFELDSWRWVKRHEKSSRYSVRQYWEAHRTNRLLADFLNKPWFTRVWIVQEIVLGPKAALLCGSLSLDWEAVEKTGWVTKSFDTLGGRATILNMFAQLKLLIKPPNDLEYFHTMAAFWNQNATNPRDQIYGILGLINEGNRRMGIKPRYEAEAEDVFLDFTRTHIARTGSLLILAMGRGCRIINVDNPHGKSKQRLAWPSWMLDWSWGKTTKEPHPTDLFNWEGNIRGSPHFFFRAGGPTKPKPIFSEDGHRLCVPGIFLDIISETSSVYEAAEKDLGRFETLSEIWNSEYDHIRTFRHFASLRRMFATNAEEIYEPTGETVLEALIGLWTFTNIPPMPEGFNLEGRISMNTALRADTRIASAMLRGRRKRQQQQQQQPQNQLSKRAALLEALLLTAKWHVGPSDDPVDEWLQFTNSMMNRRFFKTGGRLGYMGLGTRHAQAGDSVVLLQGQKAPFVLRPFRDHWVVVGECFVHGIMRGEAFDDDRSRLIWLS